MTGGAALDRRLNLRGVTSRRGTFTFELLDRRDLEHEGWLTPLEPTRIDNDADRPIHRSLSGLRLDASDWSEIDIYRHRLRVRYESDVGGSLPCGLFVFGPTDVARRAFRGSIASAAMSDQGVALDQQFGRAQGLWASMDATEWLERQFRAAGVERYEVDLGNFRYIGGHVAWGPRAVRRAAMNEVGSLVGALPVYFDNGGVGRMLTANRLSQQALRYPWDGPTARIYDGTAVEREDPTRAPNVYVVIDTSGGREVSARFRIPAHAPHSVERRGYQVPKVVETQGARTKTAAMRRAVALYQRGRGAHKTVTFVGPPDPRHDTYNLVQYGEHLYREARWSMQCVEGGEHRHDLRRHYLASDVDLPDVLEIVAESPNGEIPVEDEEPPEEVVIGGEGGAPREPVP